MSTVINDEMVDRLERYNAYKVYEVSKGRENHNTTAYELDKEELIHFGLTPNESKVYIYLLQNAAKKADEIAEELHIRIVNMYFILAELQNKGLITTTFHHPLKYSAIPFYKSVKLLATQRNVKMETSGRSCKVCDITIDFNNTTIRDAFLAELCDKCYGLQNAIVEDIILV